MDQQHQIPLLFVRIRRCVAERLPYSALMLNIHASYPAFTTVSYGTPQEMKSPGVRYRGQLIPSLGSIMSKPSDSELSKYHGPQRP